jgi:hypothetical protein
MARNFVYNSLQGLGVESPEAQRRYKPLVACAGHRWLGPQYAYPCLRDPAVTRRTYVQVKGESRASQPAKQKEIKNKYAIFMCGGE